ncbi:MAG: glycosyltransferase [Candidatus Liptonbacteria bacterium]|nr:glycosyltransferase [Parcubacteria group bacterium]MBI4087352.1 glycosyltransferase [Candidatus Liptonbacteria bacterium]
MSSALVTIGMPVYNGAAHLREAFDSLFAQTYRNFEILISDNASTDATREICEEYAKKDSRIRFVRQKENIGAIPNFEFVKKEARGKYFMWAAYDDLWDSRFLEKCAGELERDPSLALAMSDFDRFDPESGMVEHYNIQGSLPSEKSLYGRLKRHILFYLNDGKGVPIYGVWRTSMIADVPLRRDWSYFPVRFIFESLFRGGAGLIHETLFFKRAPLPREEKKKILPARMVNTFQDRIRKFFGSPSRANMQAVFRSRELGAWEKVRLVFWQCAALARLFLARKT